MFYVKNFYLPITELGVQLKYSFSEKDKNMSGKE